MFAKKLGRVAGLVLALAVVFGGVGLAAGGADQTQAAPQSQSAPQYSNLIVDWE